MGFTGGAVLFKKSNFIQILTCAASDDRSEISMAATTALFDPFEKEWSSLICYFLDVPMECLPRVVDSDSDEFGFFSEFNLKISITSDASVTGC